MANWFIAPLQFGIGIVHRLVIFLNARYISLYTASAFGNSEAGFIKTPNFRSNVLLLYFLRSLPLTTLLVSGPYGISSRLLYDPSPCVIICLPRKELFMPLYPLPHVPLKNQLLSALPSREYERLLPSLEMFECVPGRVLYEITDTVGHVYFPLSGMISLLAITKGGDTIEIATVGNEGVIGLPAILRTHKSPYRVIVQIRGRAIRIRANPLRGEFDRGGRLQDVLLRYTYMLLMQISQSAVCNHFHTVEQRLSRWLLVTRDRGHSNEFHLTQEVISQMLGIPRTNITMRVGALQRKGLIRCGRGKITIVDPDGLEHAACECYRMVKEEISGFLAA
jgi:CRP-like cAMP-binding protein